MMKVFSQHKFGWYKTFLFQDLYRDHTCFKKMLFFRHKSFSIAGYFLLRNSVSHIHEHLETRTFNIYINVLIIVESWKDPLRRGKVKYVRMSLNRQPKILWNPGNSFKNGFSWTYKLNWIDSFIELKMFYGQYMSLLTSCFVNKLFRIRPPSFKCWNVPINVATSLIIKNAFSLQRPMLISISFR